MYLYPMFIANVLITLTESSGVRHHHVYVDALVVVSYAVATGVLVMVLLTAQLGKLHL